MGTNYYCYIEDPCPHCGKGGDSKHIGKSSAGWCFALHVYPSEGINTLEDWKHIWEGKNIVDEYGCSITADEMLKLITDRKGSDKIDFSISFLDRNFAAIGPNNLLSSRVDGYHCIGGEGTVDYIIVDFS